MTTAIRPRTRSFADARPDAHGMPALVETLRVAAKSLVPFSQPRLLLLQAAAAIERLERQRTEQAGEPSPGRPA